MIATALFLWYVIRQAAEGCLSVEESQDSLLSTNLLFLSAFRHRHIL